MEHTTLSATTLHAPTEPTALIVLVPGLGTDVASTWARTAAHLVDGSAAAGPQVIGVDLPGHGLSAPWTDAPAEPTMADLGDLLVEAVVEHQARHSGMAEVPVTAAGTSLAGGLMLQLGIDHADRFAHLVVVGGAPRFGEPQTWIDRAETIRASGTASLAEGSADKWFTEDFRREDPHVVEAVLDSLRAADDASYAALCSVQSRFDLRERLSEVGVPVLAVAGEHDPVAPPEQAEIIAAGVPRGSATTVPGVAHQIPTQKPTETAELLRGFRQG